MSHTQRVSATYTDANGAQAEGYTEQTVFEKPSCALERVGTGPVYPGDTIVVRVVGTTDPAAGPGVAAVEGGTPNADGTFSVTAA